jgi:tetraacyldisaccharide-1-P 4'-kinase
LQPEIEKLIEVQAKESIFSILKNKKIFGFAGLADPTNFHKSLERLKMPVQDFFGLPDHVNYSANLIKEITERAKNCDYCITTEKDAVKLQDWPAGAPTLFSAPIELKLKGNIEGLYEKINECLRKNN